ncbi:MAG TPA: ABC transporter transmembrane domain-containing protein, partial [Micromonosporaceae bacterium]|nr:ABC transporter transmembrane domain-containing protein [Micromonosporaceae bacterium]
MLVGTALVGTATSLAMPAALGRAVDGTVAGRDAVTWLAVVAGLIVVGLGCELLSLYGDAAATARTTAWLRNHLVTHLLGLGPGTGRFDGGDLVSRVSSNAATAGRAGPAIVAAVMAAVPPLGALTLLAYIDVWVAAAFLAGTGLVGLVLRAFTRRTATLVSDYQKAQGRIAARLAESLTGARTIAAADTAAQEQRRVLAGLPDL